VLENLALLHADRGRTDQARAAREEADRLRAQR
jgi:hypothetical protein